MENVQHADATDQEFLAAAVRRIPAGLLTIVVCTDAGELADPPGTLSVSLPAALGAYTTRITGSAPAPVPDEVSAGPAAAQRYVDADGADDDPALLRAYERLAPAERAPCTTGGPRT